MKDEKLNKKRKRYNNLYTINEKIENKEINNSKNEKINKNENLEHLIKEYDKIKNNEKDIIFLKQDIKDQKKKDAKKNKSFQNLIKNILDENEKKDEEIKKLNEALRVQNEQNEKRDEEIKKLNEQNEKRDEEFKKLKIDFIEANKKINEKFIKNKECYSMKFNENIIKKYESYNNRMYLKCNDKNNIDMSSEYNVNNKDDNFAKNN